MKCEPYNPPSWGFWGAILASEQVAITALLGQWRGGDGAAANALAQHLYPVLRGLVGAQLRRAPAGLTLSATELANEAYIRLDLQRGVDWQNRDHFFAIVATVVRRVVVDYLRERSAHKRGCGKVMLDIHDLPGRDEPATGDRLDWLALDQALERLQALDPACARVVELKLFAGLTTERIAGICGSSTATVGRQWRFARTWLAEQLEFVADAG